MVDVDIPTTTTTTTTTTTESDVRNLGKGDELFKKLINSYGTWILLTIILASIALVFLLINSIPLIQMMTRHL